MFKLLIFYFSTYRHYTTSLLQPTKEVILGRGISKINKKSSKLIISIRFLITNGLI